VNSVVNTEYNGKKDHTHSKHTPQWRLTMDKDKYHLKFLGKCYFIQKFPIISVTCLIITTCLLKIKIQDKESYKEKIKIDLGDKSGTTHSLLIDDYGYLHLLQDSIIIIQALVFE